MIQPKLAPLSENEINKLKRKSGEEQKLSSVWDNGQIQRLGSILMRVKFQLSYDFRTKKIAKKIVNVDLIQIVKNLKLVNILFELSQDIK